MDVSSIAGPSLPPGKPPAPKPEPSSREPAPSVGESPSSGPSSASAPGQGPGTSPSANDVYYTNPALKFDPATGAVVREWRDSRTGVKEYQIPSQKALVYQKTQELGGDSSSASVSKASSRGPSSFSADSQSGPRQSDPVRLTA